LVSDPQCGGPPQTAFPSPMIGPRRSIIRPRDAPPGGLRTALPEESASGHLVGSGSRSGFGSFSESQSSTWCAAEEGSHGEKRRKKKKRPRYAWMDSNDDDDDSSHEGGGSSADKSDAGEAAQGDDFPLPASVAEVQSFSEMVRMAPNLRVRASSMSPAEVSAVCAAAARVLFCDAALLQALTSRLRLLLARRGGGLSAGMLVTVLSGLASLNTYDKEVFVAAVAVLSAPGAADRLDMAQRRQLLTALRTVKHEGADDFVEALARRERSERYEAAKDELMQRSLQRMYGETLDLQGASEDVERALLKPRFQKTRTRLR